MEHIKIEGKSVFAELHQRGPMGIVDAVFPNTEEHERLIDMMNKQMAAFLRNYLCEKQASMAFINELMKNYVEPMLNHSAHRCKWDGETNTLTTPDESKDNEAREELEVMLFFANKIDKILGDELKGKKKSQMQMHCLILMASSPLGQSTRQMIGNTLNQYHLKS